MGIEDIMAEKQARGELDSELAQYAPQRRQSRRREPMNSRQMQQGQQSQTQPRRGSLMTALETGQYSREDIRLAVDIGIFVMLVLIWSRV